MNNYCFNDDKKIALFVPTLAGGGAERVMVTLANGFAQRGYAVDLVLAQATGVFFKDLLPQINIVDLRASRILMAFWPLRQYLKNKRPSVLLSAMNHANVVALLANLTISKPIHIVVSEHSTISVEASQTKSWLARVVYFLVKVLYPYASARVAVSKSAAKDLASFIGLPNDMVTSVYNPFDLEEINAKAQEPLNHPWFKKDEPPVVLAIGRLTAAKDFANLFKAFALLRTKRQARLMVLGEGPERCALEQLAFDLSLSGSEFEMPGFVSNPFALLAASDVFVLSSKWEGFGNVVVEALCCGTCVVSTDCPSGPREILQDGRWGKLVPTQDPIALCGAIDKVLSTSKEDRPNVKLRAKDFDESNAVDAYLKVFSKVISH